MERKELVSYLASLLKIEAIKDYAPNGCQIEGSSDIKSIVCGVTASMALIDAAIACGADTILVHHGYFWSNESRTIESWRHARIAKLLDARINLLAYHLPLDIHPTLGNNAQLAQQLGWTIEGQFGPSQLGFWGTCAPQSLDRLAIHIAHVLGRESLVLSADHSRIVSRLAWCSGAAQSFVHEALHLDVDVFMTGEVSEFNYHLALETQTAFISAGHHATERYGIQALGQHLSDVFGLSVKYIDLPNPV